MASLDTQSQSLYNAVVSWLRKWSQYSSAPCICLLYKATLRLVAVRGGINFPTPWIWAGPAICFGRMQRTGWCAPSEPEAFLEPRCAHVYKPRLACRLLKDVWSSRLLPQLAACQQSDKRMRPSQNSQPWAKLPPDSQWASPAEVSPDWPRSSEPSWNIDSWAVEAAYWFKPLGFVVAFMQHFCGNKKTIQVTYKVLRDPQLPLFFWLHLLLLSGSLVHRGPSHSDLLCFSWTTPPMLQPQSLCTCYFLCLECFALHIPLEIYFEACLNDISARVRFKMFFKHYGMNFDQSE